MSSIDKKIAMAIHAGIGGNKRARQLVGRLLTPVELDQVAGGGGGCSGGDGDHMMNGNSSFDQSGGSYTQNGGSYGMKCAP